MARADLHRDGGRAGHLRRGPVLGQGGPRCAPGHRDLPGAAAGARLRHLRAGVGPVAAVDRRVVGRAGRLGRPAAPPRARGRLLPRLLVRHVLARAPRARALRRRDRHPAHRVQPPQDPRHPRRGAARAGRLPNLPHGLLRAYHPAHRRGQVRLRRRVGARVRVLRGLRGLLLALAARARRRSVGGVDDAGDRRTSISNCFACHRLRARTHPLRAARRRRLHARAHVAAAAVRAAAARDGRADYARQHCFGDRRGRVGGCDHRARPPHRLGGVPDRRKGTRHRGRARVLDARRRPRTDRPATLRRRLPRF